MRIWPPPYQSKRAVPFANSPQTPYEVAALPIIFERVCACVKRQMSTLQGRKLSADMLPAEAVIGTVSLPCKRQVCSIDGGKLVSHIDLRRALAKDVETTCVQPGIKQLHAAAFNARLCQSTIV
jgi:hypothetical protein